MLSLSALVYRMYLKPSLSSTKHESFPWICFMTTFALLGPQIPYLGFCSCEEQGDTGVWQLVDPPILPLTHGPNHSFDWRETLLQEWRPSDPNFPEPWSCCPPADSSAPHNTETFSLSASPHSCWVSSDGWRGFPPEDEKPRPQPVNGRPTECIPLRPHSDFIVLLCFLEEWGWVGVRCAVWESAHWNPAARFSLRKCCEISMFPNSAAENQSYQHECISWRTTDCDSGWQ